MGLVQACRKRLKYEMAVRGQLHGHSVVGRRCDPCVAFDGHVGNRCGVANGAIKAAEASEYSGYERVALTAGDASPVISERN